MSTSSAVTGALLQGALFPVAVLRNLDVILLLFYAALGERKKSYRFGRLLLLHSSSSQCLLICNYFRLAQLTHVDGLRIL